MRAHFIKSETSDIAYFPDSKRFFKINSVTKKLIEIMMLSNNSINPKEFNISLEDIELMKSKILNYSKPIESCKCINTKKELGRLVIHISNICNLRCKYCYANGGHYYSDETLLTKKKLDKILDRFFNEFEVIHNIQLFGGEPLLNMDLIEYIAEKLQILNSTKNTNTTLGLITNGTLIDDRFIDLVSKYNIYVTVSYDGDTFINDLLRVDTNNKGTSDIVIQNMSKLKKLTSEPSTIEVTYTQYHVDNKVSIYDVVKHINIIMPNTHIHIVPACGDQNCDFALKDLGCFKDSVTDLCNLPAKELDEQELNNYTYSLIQRILSGLHSKSPANTYICDAGVGTLSVSVNGDVYPCFMFTDLPDIKLGNISDDNLFSSKKYTSRLLKLNKVNSKIHNGICEDCFLNTSCSGCLGTNLFNTGDVFNLDEKTCDMHRNMFENCIIQISSHIDQIKEGR